MLKQALDQLANAQELYAQESLAPPELCERATSLQFPSKELQSTSQSTPTSLQFPSKELQSTSQSTPASTNALAPHTTLLYVGFNQDHGCFACGTETGFRIFNCDPFKETFRREFDGGGIRHIQMLFRCNVLALVGGGKNPRYSPNKVMIWDDHQNRCIGELSFRNDVRAVRLRRDRIVVILEHKIYVYNFADLKLLHQIETLSNTIGLCVLSPASNACILACPGQRKGEVRIELYNLKKTRFIQAHESSLVCLALSLDGSILATASSKGTLIRIFNTCDGAPLQELRRGAERAVIYSLAFSANMRWLALSSDKGTVHVFGLKAFSSGGCANTFGLNATSISNDNLSTPSSKGLMMVGSSLLTFAGSNVGSSLSFIKGVLPKYFSSEWSFAQFRVPEDTISNIAFGPQKNTIIIVCTDGRYYRCAFDPIQGGQMTQQDHGIFLKSDSKNSTHRDKKYV